MTVLFVQYQIPYFAWPKQLLTNKYEVINCVGGRSFLVRPKPYQPDHLRHPCSIKKVSRFIGFLQLQGKFCSCCIETTKILYHRRFIAYSIITTIGMNAINTSNLIVGLRLGWMLIKISAGNALRASSFSL